MKFKTALFFFLSLFTIENFASNNCPNIVTSIRPIHSIVQNISCCNKNKLLFTRNRSIHHYNLSPSEVKNLFAADYIIMVSKNLESSLYNLIQKNKHLKNKVILLDEIPGIIQEKYKQVEKTFEFNAHHHSHGSFDPHIWLNPKNAKIIAQFLINKIYPKSTCTTKKSINYLKKIKQLQKTVTQKLANHSNKSVVATHNAFGHLLNQHQINLAGVVLTNNHTPPSLKQILELKNFSQSKNIQCIILEPGFNHKKLTSLFPDDIPKVYLDVEWGSSKNDQDVYIDIITETVDKLSTCLSKKSD